MKKLITVAVLAFTLAGVGCSTTTSTTTKGTKRVAGFKVKKGTTTTTKKTKVLGVTVHKSTTKSD